MDGEQCLYGDREAASVDDPAWCPLVNQIEVEPNPAFVPERPIDVSRFQSNRCMPRTAPESPDETRRLGCGGGCVEGRDDGHDFIEQSSVAGPFPLSEQPPVDRRYFGSMKDM